MAITFWVPMIPAFCISAGILIEGLTSLIRTGAKDKASLESKISYYMGEGTPPKKKMARYVGRLSEMIFPIVLTVIVVIGLTGTITLITTNLNSSFFELYAFIVGHLPDSENSINVTKTLLVGSAKLRSFYWIPEYVIYDGDRHNNFEYKASPLKENFQNKKLIVLSDRGDLESYIENSPKDFAVHKSLYNDTREIAEFKDRGPLYDREKYPYTNMIENRGMGEIRVRGN